MDKVVYASNLALYMVIMLSAPPIIIATVVGVAVALVQALTHVQEQTLPFGVKLLAVCISLYMMAGWFTMHIKRFSVEVIDMAFR